MKKTLLSTVFALIAITCFSQDYITLKNGTLKTVIVSEITPEFVKYRDFDNQNGALYTISKSDVLKVLFQNGKEEIFEETPKPNSLELVNNKIYMNGEKLSDKEIKALFQGTNALGLYNQSKTMKRAGTMVSILGAVICGIGIGGFISNGDESLKSVDPIISKSESVICTVTGGICMISGIVLTYQSSSAKKKAVNMYNNSSRKSSDLSLNIGFTGNGIGMQLTF